MGSEGNVIHTKCKEVIWKIQKVKWEDGRIQGSGKQC